MGPRAHGARVLAELARLRGLRAGRGMALRSLGHPSRGHARRAAARRGAGGDEPGDVAPAVLPVVRPAGRGGDRVHLRARDHDRHALVRPVARHGDGDPQRGERGQRDRLLSDQRLAHRDARVARGTRRLRRDRGDRGGRARAVLPRSAGRRGDAAGRPELARRAVDAAPRARELPAVGRRPHDDAGDDGIPDHGDASSRPRGGSRLRAGVGRVALRARRRLHDGRQPARRLALGPARPRIRLRARIDRRRPRDRRLRGDARAGRLVVARPLHGVGVRPRHADRAALRDSGRRVRRAPSRHDPRRGAGGRRRRRRDRPVPRRLALRRHRELHGGVRRRGARSRRLRRRGLVRGTPRGPGSRAAEPRCYAPS